MAVAVAEIPGNLASLARLERWRCANPLCLATRQGRPRVLFEARLPAGSIVEKRCPICHNITTVIVTDSGIEYRVRPASDY